MNPKPLSALTHLTVPVAMSSPSWRIVPHDFRERLSRRTSNLREELDTPRGTQIHSYGQRRATASTLLHRSLIWESDRADGPKTLQTPCWRSTTTGAGLVARKGVRWLTLGLRCKGPREAAGHDRQREGSGQEGRQEGRPQEGREAAQTRQRHRQVP